MHYIKLFSKYSTLPCTLLLPCTVWMYVEQFQVRCATWGYVALSEYMPSYFTQSCPWCNLTNTVPFHPWPTHLNPRWPVSLHSSPFHARSSAIPSYPVSRAEPHTNIGRQRKPTHQLIFFVVIMISGTAHGHVHRTTAMAMLFKIMAILQLIG